MVIKVSYAAMEQANAQIIQISGTIAEKLDLLQQGLAKMVWVGGDAEAYARYKRDWDNAVNDLNAILAQIGAAVNTARDNYHGNELANTNLWNV